MITGSPAVTVRLWMRASGVRLCAFKAASETISAALAPSQIWLELAAVSRPSGLSSFTPAMDSSVASKRMPSSTVCIAGPSGVSMAMGTISPAKAFALVAAIALRWLESANASS